MEGILDQCGLWDYAGMAIMKDRGWVGQYIIPLHIYLGIFIEWLSS